jgi:hypothetical protein
MITGRSLSLQSRNGKIAQWLGDRGMSVDELRGLGLRLQVQGSARRFLTPLRRYFDGLPMRYRRFRRERQAEGSWYKAEGISPTELTWGV